MITNEEGMNNKNDVGQKSPPGLVGLQNLGNTCYMNGALQALSNCQQLTRFLLDSPAYLKDKSLCHSYSELIKQIWDKPDSHYAAPTSIIRIIKCIYPDFRGCTQQDTQEFLRCFLEQLHTELKEERPNDIPELNKTSQEPTASTSGEGVDSDVDIQNNNNIDRTQSSSNDDLTTTTTTTSTATRNCNTGSSDKSGSNNNSRSIISDIFEFKISSSVVCSSCNNTSTTIESFKDLSIPIPSRDHPYYHGYVNNNNNNNNEQQASGTSSSPSSILSRTTDLKASTSNNKNKKSDIVEDKIYNQEIQNYSYPIFLAEWFWDWLGYFRNWFWAPSVALDDCLSIFFGTDPLEGDNEYSCEVCNKKNKGVKYLKILELPEVLCIHFKRYESASSSKITTHVSFPLENLDLSAYMCDNARPQNTSYRLISCICHHGSALLTGHYTTYAINCYDDQWYEFDDEYVTNVDQSQVEDSEAYILFYQRQSSTNGDDDYDNDETTTTTKTS